MIVTEDFDGNRTTVEGQLLAGSSFEIAVATMETQTNRTRLELRLPLAHEAKAIAAHMMLERWRGTNKPTWRAARTERASQEELLLAALPTDSTALPQPVPPQRVEPLWVYGEGAKLLRVQAQDQHGVFSLPAFAQASTAIEASQPFYLEVKKDFFTRHLRLEVVGNLPFQNRPHAMFSAGEHALAVELIPQEPNRYIATVPLAQIAADSVLLTVTATSMNGAQSTWEEKFGNVALTPERGGTLAAADGRLRARFESGALYETLYGRVVIAAERAAHPLVLGPIYRIAPHDVPLRTQAVVAIAYPDSVSNPAKLGIAARNDSRANWNFIASKRNAFARTLSAEISSLGEFAVMRDEEPPLLLVQSPLPGARTKTRRPQISCRVADQISGFNSERDIQLRLDGKLLIAEYDPEREVVQWRPKVDLAPGTHVLAARAEDQCGNVTEREVQFVVP